MASKKNPPLRKSARLNGIAPVVHNLHNHANHDTRSLNSFHGLPTERCRTKKNSTHNTEKTMREEQRQQIRERLKAENKAKAAAKEAAATAAKEAAAAATEVAAAAAKEAAAAAILPIGINNLPAILRTPTSSRRGREANTPAGNASDSPESPVKKKKKVEIRDVPAASNKKAPAHSTKELQQAIRMKLTSELVAKGKSSPVASPEGYYQPPDIPPFPPNVDADDCEDRQDVETERIFDGNSYYLFTSHWLF